MKNYIVASSFEGYSEVHLGKDVTYIKTNHLPCLKAAIEDILKPSTPLDFTACISGTGKRDIAKRERYIVFLFEGERYMEDYPNVKPEITLATYEEAQNILSELSPIKKEVRKKERYKSLDDARRKETELLYREIDLKEAELDNREKELKLREKELEQRQQELEMYSAGLRERSKELFRHHEDNYFPKSLDRETIVTNTFTGEKYTLQARTGGYSLSYKEGEIIIEVDGNEITIPRQFAVIEKKSL